MFAFKTLHEIRKTLKTVMQETRQNNWYFFQSFHPARYKTIKLQTEALKLLKNCDIHQMKCSLFREEMAYFSFLISTILIYFEEI